MGCTSRGRTHPRYTETKTFSDYENDDFLRSAVERQFEVIGEALGQVRRLDAATAARIPDLARVVAFRNLLIHAYASVDNRIVWGVIEGGLRSLSATLSALLSQS